MDKWEPSRNSISDINEWAKSGRLEIRPDYQRLAVWSLPAKIMLIDTILKGIPMPKIFVSTMIKDDKTHRAVIDGQQRISAILEFLRDQFPLDNSFDPEIANKYFSKLPKKARDKILGYAIDFNEGINATNDEAREVYSRVNKYTVALTKQELRKADYPGAFLELSEELSDDEFLDEARVFTPAARRRFGDVEFVSEILAAMIGKIQDKKQTLDDYYRVYANWSKRSSNKIGREFAATIIELKEVFGDGIELARTRFRQKADFYSLFLTIVDFVRSGASSQGKDLEPLRSDLKLLSKYIRPESDIEILKDYAIKCVSQANSASSRRWRKTFMTAVLKGTYLGASHDPEEIEILYRIKEDYDLLIGTPFKCGVCKKRIKPEDLEIGWRKDDQAHQVSNSTWLHKSCAGDKAWTTIARPVALQSSLFESSENEAE